MIKHSRIFIIKKVFPLNGAVYSSMALNSSLPQERQFCRPASNKILTICNLFMLGPFFIFGIIIKVYKTLNNFKKISAKYLAYRFTSIIYFPIKSVVMYRKDWHSKWYTNVSIYFILTNPNAFCFIVSLDTTKISMVGYMIDHFATEKHLEISYCCLSFLNNVIHR